MGKVIDGIRLEKMGTGGVVSYLKGKGVKDEEIKWSGIESFIGRANIRNKAVWRGQSILNLRHLE